MTGDLDTDNNEQSIHHTLGPNKGQASPGDHEHQGGNSKALFAGYSLTGSDPTEVIDSLVAILIDFGLTDERT